MTLRFRPELPGLREPMIALPSGTRSALRLLLNVAEENGEDNEELVEAIEIGDEILTRLSPHTPRVAGSSQD